MNKIAHMFVQVCLLAACLSLAACCNPSTSVVKLMDQAVTNEDLLTKQHLIACENQQKIVGALPELYQVTSRILSESCQSSANSKVLMLQAKIDTAEQKLQIQFENKAWDLISEQFPVQFQSAYQDPVNAFMNEEQSELNELNEKRKKFPNDSAVANEYNRKKLHVNSLYLVSLEDEVKLRNDLMEKIERTRIRVFGEIHEAMNSVRKKVQEFKSTACSDPKPAPEELVILQRALEQLRDPVFILHAEQKKSLETLSEYINRPSQVELILVGTGSALSEKIGELQQSTQIGLSGLEHMISMVGGDVTTAVVSETESIGNHIERILLDINGKINSEISRISNGITKEASKMAIKLSQAVE